MAASKPKNETPEVAEDATPEIVQAPQADPEDSRVGRMSEDELAEIKAMLAAREEAPKAEADDLTKTGRVRTKVDTNTIVEDRTSEPARKPGIEYQVETQTLDNGTILTTVGDVK